MRLYDIEVAEIAKDDTYRLSIEEWGDDGVSFCAYLSRPQLERLQGEINYAPVGRMMVDRDIDQNAPEDDLPF
jgi:hypothetical protein